MKVTNFGGCHVFTIPVKICKLFNIEFGDIYNMEADKNKLVFTKLKEQPKPEPPDEPIEEEVDEPIEEIIEEPIEEEFGDCDNCGDIGELREVKGRGKLCTKCRSYLGLS